MVRTSPLPAVALAAFVALTLVGGTGTVGAESPIHYEMSVNGPDTAGINSKININCDCNSDAMG